MKHPLWIVNSTFLFLLLVLLGFIYFSQEHTPYKEDIEPEVYAKKPKDVVSKVNIEKIWQNDLFNTYQRPTKEPEVISQIPLPPPPTPQATVIPEIPKSEFLDPLDITLRGIMIIVNDDTKNRATIAHNKLGRENVYKVGDMIEDAQLLRIFNNKVIFIRSNGQQEVLYLRERDAKMDPAYALIGGWDEVVQKIADNNYVISPIAFTQRVTNLAQFIDMLDLTTVYKEGKSIGIRIGQVTPDSLGSALGLQQNDVIISINDISTADTNSRFTLYKIITAMNQNDVISIICIRQNQLLSITYTLEDFKRPEGAPHVQEVSVGEDQKPISVPMQKPIELSPTQQEEKQIQLLQEQHHFAPTIKEIRARERSNMMRKGKAPSTKKFKLAE